MRLSALLLTSLAFIRIAHAQDVILTDDEQTQCVVMTIQTYTTKEPTAFAKKQEVIPTKCKAWLKQKRDAREKNQPEANQLARAKEKARLNPSEPTPIDTPAPRYPSQAIRQRIEGVVILQLVVGVNGHVSNATIKTSSGSPVLDQAALDATKTWLYIPAMQNGVMTPTEIAVPLTFSLNP